jgi:hypothetical protein
MDALFHVDVNTGATAIVLGDYHGSFIAARCLFLPHVASVVIVEAIAMHEGLSLASVMRYNNLDR